MEASYLSNELNQYLAQLTAGQRESVIAVIGSFTRQPGTSERQLEEPDASYTTRAEKLSPEILQLLTWEQKEALISLIESFGIDISNKRISIEQYNKEIDEAMARMDAGEFYTQEQVVEMSKTWVNGK